MNPMENIPLVKESLASVQKPLSVALINLAARFNELNGFDYLLNMMNVT
jgi:hypothetical protein